VKAWRCRWRLFRWSKEGCHENPSSGDWVGKSPYWANSKQKALWTGVQNQELSQVGVQWKWIDWSVVLRSTCIHVCEWSTRTMHKSLVQGLEHSEPAQLGSSQLASDLGPRADISGIAPSTKVHVEVGFDYQTTPKWTRLAQSTIPFPWWENSDGKEVTLASKAIAKCSVYVDQVEEYIIRGDKTMIEAPKVAGTTRPYGKTVLPW